MSDVGRFTRGRFDYLDSKYLDEPRAFAGAPARSANTFATIASRATYQRGQISVPEELRSKDEERLDNLKAWQSCHRKQLSKYGRKARLRIAASRLFYRLQILYALRHEVIKRNEAAAFLGPAMGIVAITVFIAVASILIDWNGEPQIKLMWSSTSQHFAQLSQSVGTALLMSVPLAFIINWAYRHRSAVLETPILTATSLLVRVTATAALFFFLWTEKQDNSFAWWLYSLLLTTIYLAFFISKHIETTDSLLRRGLDVLWWLSTVAFLLVAFGMLEIQSPKHSGFEPDIGQALTTIGEITIFLGGVYLAWFLFGYLALRHVPIAAFAEVLCGRKGYDYAIKSYAIVAHNLLDRIVRKNANYRIHSFPQYLEAQIRLTQRQLGHAVEPEDFWLDTDSRKKLTDRMIRWRNQVSSLINENSVQLERLSECQRLIGQRIDIPSTRLAETICRFDPETFRQRMEKLQINLAASIEILEHARDHPDPNEVGRFYSLIRQVERIMQQADRAVSRHRVLISHPDQLLHISSMLTDPAASSAVQTYAKAIESFHSEPENINYGFELLYDAQRTRSYTDVHHHLKLIVEFSESDSAERERHLTRLFEEFGMATSSRLSQQSRAFTVEQEQLFKLRNLLYQTNRVVSDARWQLMNGFQTVLNQIEEDRVILVTVNYSKAVKTIVRDSIENVQSKAVEVCFSLDADNKRGRGRRLMRHELLHDSHLRRGQIVSIDLTDLARLREVVGSEPRVLILIGCETYTGPKINQPKTAIVTASDELLSGLQQAIVGDRRTEIVLVAENYKYRKSIDRYFNDVRQARVSRLVDDKSFFTRFVPCEELGRGERFDHDDLEL